MSVSGGLGVRIESLPSVRLGYFRCSQGTRIRPSAIALIGKSIFGSWQYYMSIICTGLDLWDAYLVLKLLDHAEEAIRTGTDTIGIIISILDVYRSSFAIANPY